MVSVSVHVNSNSTIVAGCFFCYSISICYKCLYEIFQDNPAVFFISMTFLLLIMLIYFEWFSLEKCSLSLDHRTLIPMKKKWLIFFMSDSSRKHTGSDKVPERWCCGKKDWVYCLNTGLGVLDKMWVIRERQTSMVSMSVSQDNPAVRSRSL